MEKKKRAFCLPFAASLLMIRDRSWHLLLAWRAKFSIVGFFPNSSPCILSLRGAPTTLLLSKARFEIQAKFAREQSPDNDWTGAT